MNSTYRTFFAGATIAALVCPAIAAPANNYESIRQEITQAVARGNQWLAAQQAEDGHWGDEKLPAFTALALNAAVRAPGYQKDKPLPPNLQKGFDWLLSKQQEDGGIYDRGLSVYNTAIALTAMAAADREEFYPAMVKARKHLIDQQWDIGTEGETDNQNDGGIGYGSSKEHTDMSNTYLAIEALAVSKYVTEDGKYAAEPDLDWDAAVQFLSRCQNLTQTNDLDWASDDPVNKGGFVYQPGDSKAGDMELEDGKIALRSYGSISYAGLLSMIYAKLSPSDPRVEAVKEWLGKNYTVTENPGMGAQGLYYYYQTMSKALTAANISMLELEDGSKADWRSELAGEILKIQKADGTWQNENGRWMESDPILVTAYTVLSLEQVLDAFPR